MTEGSPNHTWPGADDKVVIEEMLRDSTSEQLSEQWYECRIFVRDCVQRQGNDIPQDDREDIVQDVMMRIHKSLHTFAYGCKLTTWIFGIVHNRITDIHRQSVRTRAFIATLPDHHDEIDHEGDTFIARNVLTPEEACIIQIDLERAIVALNEYLSNHKHEERNRRILEMALFEGHSHIEAALAVGCSAPVASHVVREAQRYVREKLGYQRQDL
jgi:RNA polymerase sigma factor (sigma-70 family)